MINSDKIKLKNNNPTSCHLILRVTSQRTKIEIEDRHMSLYNNDIELVQAVIEARGQSWGAIDAESVARMRAQNKFQTGIDVAKYTADIMRADMEAYDADSSKYTQSLGCWHGFIGQQKMISIKKHFGGSTERRYLYLSGWMVAALRSDFGPLPDQSMHEKTSVPALIEELYTFLRQADARELGGLFRALVSAREAGDEVKAKDIQNQIDNHQTHIVPIIADIDAGFQSYLVLYREIGKVKAVLIDNQQYDFLTKFKQPHCLQDLSESELVLLPDFIVKNWLKLVELKI